jgi:hypothetical protein
MSPRFATALVLALTAAFAPAARADDQLITADPAAQALTALDGKVVWVSGTAGSQTLKGVQVAPKPASAYRSIDLGRDAGGKLVLTYLRCRTFSHCTAYRDDMNGRRKVFKGLARPGCALSTAPAVWGKHLAYGLGCRKQGRSGVYVDGRRLPLPKDAKKFGVDEITSVDLRGNRVAAIASDIYSYAFVQTLAGKQRRSFMAAASEGDSDQHALGLALGTGNQLWALTDAEHAGDPNQAVIYRQAGGCFEYETLANAPGPDQETGYRASDLAVDGNTLYLVVPGTGIVTHTFTPVRACR